LIPNSRARLRFSRKRRRRKSSEGGVISFTGSGRATAFSAFGLTAKLFKLQQFRLPAMLASVSLKHASPTAVYSDSPTLSFGCHFFTNQIFNGNEIKEIVLKKCTHEMSCAWI
jgi:hypothetical protein